MEKKGKKKDVSDFAATKKKIGPRDKSDFARGFVPKKKDVSDFAVNTKTKKVKKVSKNGNGNKTKTKKTSKPKVVTPKMIKDAGFTTLRDYLNFKQGKTRRDGKKPVRVGDKKTVANVVKPILKKNLKGKITDKKTNGSKKVASLKTSRMGIDGGASQVNKTKKTVKKNVMSTKTPKFFKGTNITPTKSQRQRMRKRMMGST